MVETLSKSWTTEDFLRDISFQGCWVVLTSFVLVVNKYILTSLGFQFPTLFLGWQTLAILLILKLDSSLFRSSKTNLAAKWKQIPPFFPVIFLHLISLYSGSRSLSRLHLHVFLPLQNFRLVLGEIFEIAFAVAQRLLRDDGESKSHLNPLPKFTSGILLLLLSFCGLFVKLHDADFSASGYRWLAVHCAAAAAADFLVGSAVAFPSSSDLTPRERALAKNAGCFLLFSVGGLFSGEVSLAAEFPHWRLYRFYLATFASGCLGGARLIFAYSLRQRLDASASSSASPVFSFSSTSASASSARAWKSAVTSEWSRMIGELNVSAKAIISLFSFAYTSFILFPPHRRENPLGDLVVLCLCLFSLAFEYGWYRLQSTLPSVPFHIFLKCFRSCRRNSPKHVVVHA